MSDTDITIRPTYHQTKLGGLALLGFVLSAIVHVLSYVGVAVPDRFPAAWALHVGIFPLFFPLVLQLRRWTGTQWNWWAGSGMRQLLRFFPAWAYALVIILWIYVPINFFYAAGFLDVVRGNGHTGALSPVMTARAFSGHWLVFYLLPALYFGFVPADAAAERAGA